MASTINAVTTGGGGVAITGDSSGNLAIQTNNGNTAMTIDTSQNVGIGTSSPSSGAKLDVHGRIRSGSGNSSGDAEIILTNYASDTTAWLSSVRQDVGGANNDLKILRCNSSGSYQGIAMQITQAEGSVLIGTTSTDVTADRVDGIGLMGGGAIGRIFSRNSSGHSMGIGISTGTQIQWWTDNGSSRVAAGTISSNGSSTAYNTTSDYRLKENVAPMTGALDVVAQLKPVTYDWISDKSKGQGFIAHELQAVVPDCVTGEKDAVDAEGNPVYQGVDTSFLVATLTAAIKELKEELDTVKAELAELKGVA